MEPITKLSDLTPLKIYMGEIGRTVIGLREEKTLNLVTKAGRQDLQSEADRQSEHLMTFYLQKHWPGLAIIGEEGTSIPGDGKFQAYYDAIDGTKPYVMGQDNFSLSLGIHKEGKPYIGVIYFPAKRLYLYAIAVQGAFLERSSYSPERIHTSVNPKKMANCLIGFDFSAGADRVLEIKRCVTPISLHSADIRIEGSFTGAMLQMIKGIWGGYVHRGASQFDLSASSVIMSEAGFASWPPKPDFDQTRIPVIFAATPSLLEEMRHTVTF